MCMWNCSLPPSKECYDMDLWVPINPLDKQSIASVDRLVNDQEVERVGPFLQFHPTLERPYPLLLKMTLR